MITLIHGPTNTKPSRLTLPEYDGTSMFGDGD